MYHHGDWDSGWFWMIPMMLVWLLMLGGIVYAAVRLALQHTHKPPLQ